jgi:membrane-associated protease RseP (regulator of RpoE activity)
LPAPSSTTDGVDWRRSGLLFAVTGASVFVTSFASGPGDHLRARAIGAFEFTATLLSILLAHEFGHYIAARLHRVPVSPPYFIPLPMLSPFGTMGAVIRMRDRIATRNALLDIGASGPLAGLALAVPLYAWGISHSKVIPLGSTDGVQLGTSILIKLLDGAFGPHVPPGHDIVLSPMAFAAWAGFFVTMINLLPLGQLDGGHVAFALLGERQNTVGKWVHRAMLAAFFAAVLTGVGRDVRAHRGLVHMGEHVQVALFWLMWFEVQAVLGSLTRPGERARLSNSTRLTAVLGLAVLASLGQKNAPAALWLCWIAGLAVLLGMELKFGILGDPSPLEHPPTNDRTLSPVRRVVAVVTLLLFVLLFMSTPMST